MQGYQKYKHGGVEELGAYTLMGALWVNPRGSDSYEAISCQ
jgi:hypothetical protein